MKEVRPSATILLARDNEDEVEVLLLKRNKALTFAAGHWVFPGGKIEPNELENSKNILEAAKLAAIRETEEESNIKVEPDALIFFRHWTTPEIQPIRFATWFFFAATNLNQTKVKIDDSEIIAHTWIKPQVALDQFFSGKMKMMPPTFISLQLIRKCNSVSEIIDLLKKEEPIYVLPIVKASLNQIIVLYEGDSAYANGDITTIGPRHRMIIDKQSGEYKFEYENCNFPAVNGGMHK